MDASPFGTLSAELRNTIYEMVLSDYQKTRTSNDVTTGIRGIKVDQYHKNITPPLAQLCRQIRNECLLMCFAETTFRFHLMYSRISQNNRYDDFKRFVRWYSAIDWRCRWVTPRIEIRLKITEGLLYKPNSQWLQANVEATKRACNRLASVLEKRGYNKSRLLVVVHIRVPSNRQAPRDDVEDAVKRVFGRVGVEPIFQ